MWRTRGPHARHACRTLSHPQHRAVSGARRGCCANERAKRCHNIPTPV
ncbi:hypothetical protein BURPS1106B_2103 [Burkholderia pseudomallei 1106b]|uniref:Uncharacterized protein n=2 Tax=Burkholderia pseudomallei TaxID=28450 RepID=A0A0E1VVE4_BURPE|nr:hypothetical protein BURPS1106A_A3068 [Burkholderia pseudomallei 1106a]EEH24769.1 conserved hypothetical protein [Burkholderia pseudomallei Pakistan 9]EES23221.1 hypothetical protein BURPS1106B_2103 [Burkholderia pseudomallei 1106b]EET04895.1 hypothetical protein BURPS1710A_A2366 [Burkholderia pseudomallei 1710a]